MKYFSYIQRRVLLTYLKARKRTDKKIADGSFFRLSKHRQNHAIKTLERLRAKIESFNYPLAGKTVAASLAAIFSLNISFAQDPFNRNDSKNPLPIAADQFQPSLVLKFEPIDMDGDGDLDLLGNDIGKLYYFKNTGTASAPDFKQQANLPFNLPGVNQYISLETADLDNDGDKDLILSDNNNGAVNYLKNTGSASNPAYTLITGTNDPFSIVTEQFDNVSLIDLDGDADLDMAVSSYNDTLVYYKNIGTAASPQFQKQSGTNDPLAGITSGKWQSLEFKDLDNDGDLDLILTPFTSTYDISQPLYYKNNGSATAPSFIQLTGTSNPVNSYGYLFPVFADFDGDSDLDVLYGGEQDFFYFKNIGSVSAPNFNLVTNPIVSLYTSSIADVDLGKYSVITFADLDGDNDPDAIAGAIRSPQYDSIVYFKNVGTSTNPKFQAQTGTNNIFAGLTDVKIGRPAFADVDIDGDLDLLYAANGTIRIYKNTGSTTQASFTEITGTNNPFDTLSGAFASTIAAVDLDSDGKTDFVFGQYYGPLRYYKNVSTGTAIQFVENTSVILPAVTQYEPAPAFADLDHDGDIDLLIGYISGDVFYFENTGSITAPSFSAATLSEPTYLNELYIIPAFVDIDGDLDSDLVFGTKNGYFVFYENVRSLTPTTDPLENKYTLFPNPATNYITYSYSKEFAGANIVMLNMKGETLQSKELDQTGMMNFEIENLEPGIYLFRVIKDNKVYIKKFIRR